MATVSVSVVEKVRASRVAMVTRPVAKVRVWRVAKARAMQWLRLEPMQWKRLGPMQWLGLVLMLGIDQ